MTCLFIKCYWNLCTYMCVWERGKTRNNQDKFHAEPLIWQCVCFVWTQKSYWTEGDFAFGTGTLGSDFNRFPGAYRCSEVFLEFLKQDKTTLTLGMRPSEFICNFGCLNSLGISWVFKQLYELRPRWLRFTKLPLACPASLSCSAQPLQLPAFSEQAILSQCFFSVQRGPISLSSSTTQF